ncbi:hypothetical protein BVC80_6635g1 [Macleaya cordata]|uniref:DUF7806 domain-containing protein n=1 Tax=Macleaya cordata TaxID=56857 RepID=A0A200QFD5_MACCD|nr:hypothetical protein BVC80_6635g1 [Macleaya cordata]
MEGLYSKLYDKYTKLKTRKDSELDRYNHDQEVKFVNYVSAAEELIEYLRSENVRLQTQIQDLANEVTSIRSDKEGKCVQYQKLLNEETEKTKQLFEEVERLRKLQEEGLSCSTKGGNNENEQLESPGDAYLEPRYTSNDSARKRPCIRHAGAQTDEERVTSYPSGHVELSVGTEIERDSRRGLLSDVDQNIQQGNCCGSIASSGDSMTANCLFQILVEFLVGMKFAFITKTEGLCLSALHQSSGYSFSLTWLSKAAGEEPAELLYHVLSLGTFERVAPEWMREDLIFSTSMCPVFFKRVSLVIGLHL